MGETVKDIVYLVFLITYFVASFLYSKTQTLSGQTPIHNTRVTSTTRSSDSPDVNNRMQKDMEQIQEDLHSGKLTEGQATSLRNKVKVVRKRELGFFKANKSKTLTDGQKHQLSQDLAAIEPSI
jgi:uncharacterized protein involved in type VI secretion and phage assembly